MGQSVRTIEENERMRVVLDPGYHLAAKLSIRDRRRNIGNADIPVDANAVLVALHQAIENEFGPNDMDEAMEYACEGTRQSPKVSKSIAYAICDMRARQLLPVILDYWAETSADDPSYARGWAKMLRGHAQIRDFETLESIYAICENIDREVQKREVIHGGDPFFLRPRDKQRTVLDDPPPEGTEARLCYVVRGAASRTTMLINSTTEIVKLPGQLERDDVKQLVFHAFTTNDEGMILPADVQATLARIARENFLVIAEQAKSFSDASSKGEPVGNLSFVEAEDWVTGGEGVDIPETLDLVVRRLAVDLGNESPDDDQRDTLKRYIGHLSKKNDGKTFERIVAVTRTISSEILISLIESQVATFNQKYADHFPAIIRRFRNEWNPNTPKEFVQTARDLLELTKPNDVFKLDRQNPDHLRILNISAVSADLWFLAATYESDPSNHANSIERHLSEAVEEICMVDTTNPNSTNRRSEAWRTATRLLDVALAVN